MGRIGRLCCRSALLASSAFSWQSWARAEAPAPARVADTPASVDLAPAASSAPAGKAPPPANAISPASLSDSLQGKAKSDYDSGRLLSDSGDFAGALLKFQSAYQEAGDPRLLWNAAACERNLRHYASAILLVRRFLADNSPLITPEARVRAQAFIEAAEPLTAPLQVESNQPNSLVFLDDKTLGAPELMSGVRIDLGTHRITVEAPGFERYSETLTVTSSSTVEVKAILRLLPSAMPVEPSTPREAPATEAHSSALPRWVWVAGGCVVLAGVVTASYFILKPGPAPEPVPGSIGSLLRF